MFPKPISPKLLLAFAILLVAMALIYTFDPWDIFSESNAKNNIVGTIVSDKRERILIRYNKIQKISVSLPDGKIVAAVGLSKNLRSCSIGDKVAVRLNRSIEGEASSYRIVSTSCSPIHW
ncbi:MAG: hypothetical protein ABJQ90_00615 [Parasphingorhabdus sp.]